MGREGDAEEPRFGSDDEAIDFVRQLANDRMPHAVRALELHGTGS